MMSLRTSTIPILALPLLLAAACDDGADLGRHVVTVEDTRQVITGPGLPNEVVPQHSNNNLDVIRHDGRVYLAFRTAPDHFASADAIIYVMSSADEVTWDYEAEYSLGTDLREPRFLAVGDELRLYISVLGTSSTAFEPMGVQVTSRQSNGTWTPLAELFGDDRVLWRTKTERDGRHYMTAYTGGESIYTFSGDPVSVHFLTSTDGLSWTPVPGGQGIVYTGGGSETAFAFGEDGDLFSVIRTEAEDANGMGSQICRAPADDLSNWSCVNDRRKYDSPLMFAHDGEIYLIGRRNLTETGEYATEGLTAIWAQLNYRREPKRCSLWRYVQDEQRIEFVLDLPSNGDTCFPGVIAGNDDDELIVYNYSSDVDAAPISWRDGQVGDTFIYRHVLRFRRR